MYIIVGLGNPGKKYDATRHNVGFDTIDHLAYKWSIDVNKVRFKALLGEGRVGNEKIILVKPQTFMNLSGESVMQIMKYYHASAEQLIVVYDDIDTALGKIRIRQKGSAGTHNGMRNIIYLLKDDSFPRIRIGIGKPEFGDLAQFVLRKFSKEEAKIVSNVIVDVGNAINEWLDHGIDMAMNRYNAINHAE